MTYNKFLKPKSSDLQNVLSCRKKQLADFTDDNIAKFPKKFCNEWHQELLNDIQIIETEIKRNEK